MQTAHAARNAREYLYKLDSIFDCSQFFIECPALTTATTTTTTTTNTNDGLGLGADDRRRNTRETQPGSGAPTPYTIDTNVIKT